MPSPPRRWTWPLLQRPIAVGVALFAVFAIFRAAAEAYVVLLLGFLALLIAVVLSFPVGWLSRVMPRAVAVVLLLVLMGGATVGAIVLALPLVSAQARELVSRAPEAINRAQSWFSRARDSDAVSQLPGGPSVAKSVEAKAGQAVESAISKVAPAALTLTSAGLTAILLLFLAAFLVSQPESYRRALRLLVPRRYEKEFDESWRRLAHELRQWVGGIFVAMTLMGTLTGIGLALAGINGWLVLALITFFGTFVPYVGALASAIPGLIVGLSQSPRHFLLAALVYLGVHLVEGYLVEPLVMRRAVKLRPASLLFWQALLGAVFGLLGTVIATPLLVCLNVLVSYLYVEKYLGKDGAPES